MVMRVCVILKNKLTDTTNYRLLAIILGILQNYYLTTAVQKLQQMPAHVP